MSAQRREPARGPMGSCVCCGGLWRTNAHRLCADCDRSCRLDACVYNPENRAARALPDGWQGLPR